MTFNIFGMKIRLIKEKDLAVKTGFSGVFYPPTKRIHIDAGYTGDKSMQVTLHEFLHAVIYRTGIDQVKLDEGVEEILCENIATALVENFTLKCKK